MKILWSIMLIWLNSCQSQLFTDFISPSSRYLILHLKDLGFANKMRAIADFSKVALLSNRKLLVSWFPSPACNSTFIDLFESGPRHVEPINLSYLPIYSSSHDNDDRLLYQAVEQATIASNMTFYAMSNIESEFVTTNNMETFFIKRDRFYSDTNVIMAMYNGGLALEDMPCQQYFTMQSTFYLSLKPIQRIREIVNNILETYFSQSLMIGIHYRDHDHVHDWEIIPPPPSSSSSSSSSSDQTTESVTANDDSSMSNDNNKTPRKALKFGEGASIEDFLLYMHQIDDHFVTISSIDGKKSSHVRFFIASNNATIKQILLKEFPSAITLFGEHNRMQSEGIKLAVIDWLLLSESAMIINTYGSSFSQEAARRKMIPLVRIYNHNLIYVDDIRLPSCGNVKFVQNGKGLRNTTYSYTEGTWDQRMISGKLMEFKRSSILSDWGFPSVYTISFS